MVCCRKKIIFQILKVKRNIKKIWAEEVCKKEARDLSLKCFNIIISCSMPWKQGFTITWVEMSLSTISKNACSTYRSQITDGNGLVFNWILTFIISNTSCCPDQHCPTQPSMIEMKVRLMLWSMCYFHTREHKTSLAIPGLRLYSLAQRDRKRK